MHRRLGAAAGPRPPAPGGPPGGNAAAFASRGCRCALAAARALTCRHVLGSAGAPPHLAPRNAWSLAGTSCSFTQHELSFFSLPVHSASSRLLGSPSRCLAACEALGQNSSRLPRELQGCKPLCNSWRGSVGARGGAGSDAGPLRGPTAVGHSPASVPLVSTHPWCVLCLH